MTGPISKEEWAKLRAETIDNIDELAAKVGGLPKVLHPYQADAVALLETGTGLVVIEKSRRIGFTWGLASYAVLRAARAKSAGGMDAMYISYNQEMTREFVDACAMWARAFAIAAAAADEFLFDDTDPDDPTETRHIKAFRIQFASGFEIIALSSAPRSLRSKGGMVIIDEAAFVDNLKELLKAALAFLMHHGQVIVCSTHDGVDNEFNTLVQDIKGGRRKGEHIRIDFDDALKQGFYQRICLIHGDEWSPEAEAQWRQDIIDFYADGADEELFCIPAQGSGAWLTAPLIEARMTLAPALSPIVRISLPDNFLHLSQLQRDHLMAPFLEEIRTALARLDHRESHAFGYDPARKRDPAVMTLLATDRLLNRRAALTVELRNVPFAEQKQIALLLLNSAPGLTGGAIDATGMGANLAEDIGREFGLRTADDDTGLIWAITLTAKWYNEHLPPLKTAFEDGSIALARDKDHLGDLRLVKVIRGIPQVPAEREGTPGNKRHGDFAVALGLAHFASRWGLEEYGYTPASADEAGRADMFARRPAGGVTPSSHGGLW